MLWGTTKTTKSCKLFLVMLHHSQYFQRKLLNLVVIRNACMVFLLNFRAFLYRFEVFVANETTMS